MTKLRIEVDRDRLTGQLQMSIGDDTGGYRLAGPEYSGHSREVFAATIDQHTAEEIRGYLDKHFPAKEMKTDTEEDDHLQGDSGYYNGEWLD